MEALIKEISLKTGITEDQAKKAITIVADNLKTKTPHVFHKQIDAMLNGGTLSEGVKNKFKELGDDAEDALKNIGQKAEEFAGDVKKKIDELFKK
jgi:predicted thioredoxin/glutaredoxin